MLFNMMTKELMVEEQTIVTPKRDGFVLVEWGGTGLDEKLGRIE